MWMECPVCHQQVVVDETRSHGEETENTEEFGIAFCSVCDTLVTIKKGETPRLASVAESVVVASASFPYLCRYIFLKWFDNILDNKARVDWDCRILSGISKGID